MGKLSGVGLFDDVGNPLECECDGVSVSLEKKCNLDPSWAAGQIRYLQLRVEDLEWRQDCEHLQMKVKELRRELGALSRCSRLEISEVNCKIVRLFNLKRQVAKTKEELEAAKRLNRAYRAGKGILDCKIQNLEIELGRINQSNEALENHKRTLSRFLKCAGEEIDRLRKEVGMS